jgi:hypothetical protein
MKNIVKRMPASCTDGLNKAIHGTSSSSCDQKQDRCRKTRKVLLKIILVNLNRKCQLSKNQRVIFLFTLPDHPTAQKELIINLYCYEFLNKEQTQSIFNILNLWGA